MEAKLRPANPLSEARAYVIGVNGSGFDLMDFDVDEDKDFAGAGRRIEEKAENIGRAFAVDGAMLDVFLPEVLRSDKARHAFSFGTGIADSGLSLSETWPKIRQQYRNLPVDQRNATVLGGFIACAQKIDKCLCASFLDEILDDPELAPRFVFLQARTGIDSEAIARLRIGIAKGVLNAEQFYQIANGTISSAPQKELSVLLADIATLENGVEAALEVFCMAAHCYKDEGKDIESVLSDAGHALLMRKDYSNDSLNHGHHVQKVMKSCYTGPQGECNARQLCQRIKQVIEQREAYPWQLDHLFDTIFELQPLVALDEFMTGKENSEYDPICDGSKLSRQSPLEKVSSDILWQWAEVDPTTRYPLIGRSLHIFPTRDFDEPKSLSPLFLEALNRSPDRQVFLNGNQGRMGPSGWSGNLSTILEKRVALLAELANHEDAAVRTWVEDQQAALSSWVDHERKRESEKEQSFE